MLKDIKKILIFTLLFVTGCTTVPKGWKPAWIEENGKVLCPYCKGEMNCVPICYGYPSEELMNEAREGKVILGGCLIEGNSMPTRAYICSNCNAKFIDERKRGNPFPGRPSKLDQIRNPYWREYGMSKEEWEEFEDIDKRDLKDRF